MGHPIHGAAARFVFMHHDPRSKNEELGLNPRYWSARWRSIAWSAGFSLQFEAGPLSEASIGNVGLNPDTVGWVGYVVTPGGAFALIGAEDVLDRFFVKWIETKTGNRVARAAVRLLFNPSRTRWRICRSTKLPGHGITGRSPGGEPVLPGNCQMTGRKRMV